MSFKSLCTSLVLGLIIIGVAHAKPSSLTTIGKKEFWRAIDERSAADLKEKDIPPKYFKQCKKKITPLNQAILNEDIAMVRLLIKKGADLNYSDKEKDTPLHTAVIVANKEIVDLLLQHPVDLDQRNSYDQTPLFIAIKNNEYDVVKKLVKKGANKEIKGEKKVDGVYVYLTPLQLAIRSSSDIAVYLVKNDVNLYEKSVNTAHPIVDAVLYKREHLIDIMLKKGVPLFYPEEVGATVLHAAAQHERAYLKRYLDLAPSGKKDQQTEYGDTPLHCAVRYGRPETVALLLERGASPHIANKQGCQPLSLVGEHQNKASQLAIAHLLIEKGVDVNALDYEFTVLGRAVLRGNMELVKLLVENKANIGQLATNRLSFRRSNLGRLFSYLLQDSGLIKFINSKTTLLHLAICEEHTAIAQFLLACHPDLVNQRDAFGCTPLHYAAFLDNVEITHDLLAHGARLDIREKHKGYTPIEFPEYMKYKNDRETLPRLKGNRVTALLEKWQKEQNEKAKQEKLRKKNENKKTRK